MTHGVTVGVSLHLTILVYVTQQLPGQCRPCYHCTGASCAETPARWPASIQHVSDDSECAGAQTAGIGQTEAAQHLLENMPHVHGGGRGCLGVVFFVGAGNKGAEQGWHVMDRQKYCTPKARSPIKESEAFVIFDEARCRCGTGAATTAWHGPATWVLITSILPRTVMCGAASKHALVCLYRGSDMKLKPDAKAILTLGPRMGRDKFMQAAMRLRQLEKGQKLVIAAPADICTSLIEVCGLWAAAAIQPKHVLEWVLWNTAKANSRVRHTLPA